MKAIRVHEHGEPEVMQLEGVPDLEPGAGEVVVAIKAAGVNPVDTYIRAGIYPAGPGVPYTPGFDGAGEVMAVGPGVSKVSEGDRVYVCFPQTGTYAEQALCLKSQVYPLPEKLSFAQGACINVPYATAWRALFHKARAEKGETVLVHGASGGVGTASVQLARQAGLKVIGTGGTEEGRRLVKEQGADFVFDHGQQDYLERIMEATNGQGVDVILEMLADVNLENDLGILAVRGRVVVIGCRGTIEINPRQMMGKDTSVLGMTLMNATEEETADMHAVLAARMEDGTIKPVIGQELPLAEAARAHHEILETRAYGQIVLIP